MYTGLLRRPMPLMTVASIITHCEFTKPLKYMLVASPAARCVWGVPFLSNQLISTYPEPPVTYAELIGSHVTFILVIDVPSVWYSRLA